eukprot:5069384-Prymnesium_polylepis.1
MTGDTGFFASAEPRVASRARRRARSWDVGGGSRCELGRGHGRERRSEHARSPPHEHPAHCHTKPNRYIENAGFGGRRSGPVCESLTYFPTAVGLRAKHTSAQGGNVPR